MTNTTAVPENFEQAAPRLIPCIWHRVSLFGPSYAAELRGESPAMWYEPLGDHLAVALICDRPTDYWNVQQDQYDQWGVSFSQAKAQAVENVRRRTPSYSQPQNGVVRISRDLASSYLLTQDWLPYQKIKGDVIAFVPRRDDLIVTGSDDLDGLRRGLDLVKQIAEGPMPVSTRAFRLCHGSWQPWLPSESHPLSDRFRLMEHVDVHAAIISQCKSLIAAGTTAFVSSPIGGQYGPPTACNWTMGIPQLMPKVDYVIFAEVADGGNSVCMIAAATWERVEAVLSHRMEAQGWYPERYLTTSSPTTSELEELDDGHLEQTLATIRNTLSDRAQPLWNGGPQT